MKNHLKLFLGILIVIIIAIGIWIVLKNKNKKEVSENTPVTVATASPDDLSDDAIFADGSVPTTWDIAGITNPIGFKKFLLALRTAVLAHDENSVVAALDPKKYTTQYALDNYDTLFNQKVVDAFQNMNIHEIFRNYEGAMIGAGTVWFEQNSDGTFSIFAINNTN